MSVLYPTSEARSDNWFAGAHTSSAFNELDRHVLASHGHRHDAAIAFIADPADGARERMSLSELLVESALAASALAASAPAGARSCATGQRVAYYLPNGHSAVVWIEAAKRLGIPYTAIAAGTASTSLGSRLEAVPSCAGHSNADVELPVPLREG